MVIEMHSLCLSSAALTQMTQIIDCHLFYTGRVSTVMSQIATEIREILEGVLIEDLVHLSHFLCS